MRTLPTLLLCALTPLAASVAEAGHGTSMLLIDNDFDGSAEVFVDGRYEGSVRGDALASFPIKPGNRTVTVQRPSGYPLLVTRVHTHPGAQVRLEVDAPTATLAVRNPSYDRVWVRVDGKSIPLAPQQGLDLRVESGNVDLLVEVRDRYGSHVVDRRNVWVEPGSVERVALASNRRPSYAWQPARPAPVPVATRPPTSSCSMHTAVAWHDHDDDDDDHRGRRYRHDD